MKKIFRILLLVAIFASLFCFIFPLFAGKYKEIYPSSPKYLKRKGDAWKNMTRIVGELKNAPAEFTIEFYSHSVGKVIKTETFNNKISVYESGWLAPGTYTLQLKAEGYDKTFIKSLKLQAETDCLINIEFGKIEYNRNY